MHKIENAKHPDNNSEIILIEFYNGKECRRVERVK